MEEDQLGTYRAEILKLMQTAVSLEFVHFQDENVIYLEVQAKYAELR